MIERAGSCTNLHPLQLHMFEGGKAKENLIPQLSVCSPPWIHCRRSLLTLSIQQAAQTSTRHWQRTPVAGVGWIVHSVQIFPIQTEMNSNVSSCLSHINAVQEIMSAYRSSLPSKLIPQTIPCYCSNENKVISF